MKSAAAAISAATAHYLQFRIQWASIVLLYYDYALTFPAEVKYIWGKKFRFSTALYICCRYALIANVLFLVGISGKIHKIATPLFQILFVHLLRVLRCRCSSLYKFDGAISILGRSAVIATLTSRTYAVYGCNRLVLVLLGSLGLTCIILDIAQAPGLNCISGNTNRIEAGLLAILMCVFEFLAAALTIARCVQECRVGRSWKFERGSFFTLVTGQGIYYYCIVSIFTTLAVILNFRAPDGTFFQRIPNALNLPVSCLLIARFLLQLREWQGRDTVAVGTNPDMNFGEDSGHAQTLSALQAVAVVDAALLDDFGDYDVSAHSSWDTESTRADGAFASGESGSPTDQIALENLDSAGTDIEEKDTGVKV